MTFSGGGNGALPDGLSGAGVYALGSRSLTFGSLNTDTTFSGVIADGGTAGGTGGAIIKVGSGATTLTGANSYTGPTTITSGVLQLGGPSTNATISGPNSFPGATLTIGNGSGSAIVRLLAQDQINDYVSTTINAGGVLDINSFSEYLAPITLNGGSIQTGGGFIYLSARPNGQAQDILTQASAATATISGRIDLNGTGVFNVAAGTTASGIDLDIPAVCFVGSLVKNGPGAMRLSAANNAYDGTMYSFNGLTLNAGTVLVGNDLAAGAAPITVTGGTIQADAAPRTLANAIHLSGALTVAGGINLTLTGVIDGSGGLTKNDSGTLTLNGAAANIYSGPTTVNAGVLQLNGPSTNATTGGLNSFPGSTLAIGNGSGSAIVRLLASNQINDFTAMTINVGGLLDINGFNEYLAPITLNGGSIQTGSGVLILAAHPNGQAQDILTQASSTTASMSGRIDLNDVGIFNVAAGETASGVDLDVAAACVDGSLVKNGAGTMRVSGANTFTRGITINEGTLTLAGGSLASDVVNGATFVYNAGAFNGRLVNSGTVVLNADFTAGGGLENDSVFTIPTGRSVTLGGAGLDNEGVLTVGGVTLKLSAAGANVNRGTMNLSATLSLAGATLTNSGSVSLAGGLVGGASGMLVNSMGGAVSGTGTIQSAFSNKSGGLLSVGSGAVNIIQGWTNSGVVQLTALNSNLNGGAIANLGGINGLGNVGSSIVNTGTIAPLGGSLYISGALSNPAAGAIRLDVGAQLFVTQGLGANAGVINLTGGAFDNNGHQLNNTGQITGYGTFSTGSLQSDPTHNISGLDNNGVITLTGGLTTVNGNVTNENGRTITVAYNPAIFTGLVTNNVGGTIHVTNTTATFAGGFTNNGNSNFIATGSGAVEITAAPTLNDGSTLSVAAMSTLRFNIATGSATIGAGVTAMVSSAATLELAGSVSALSSGANRVHIINNSLASAGILVSGAHQQVGAIDGSGATQIDAGSDLTVDRIIQSSLIIGGTAASPGRLTIEATDANGNPLTSGSGTLAQDGGLTTIIPLAANDGSSAQHWPAFRDPAGDTWVSESDFASATSLMNAASLIAKLSSANEFADSHSTASAAVPEPASLWLALLAACGVAVCSRSFSRSNPRLDFPKRKHRIRNH